MKGSLAHCSGRAGIREAERVGLLNADRRLQQRTDTKFTSRNALTILAVVECRPRRAVPQVAGPTVG